jgi:nucleoside-diphosphate-sugar epimerase
MNETVLVTGGTGFIAGWCIVELLQRGYAVRTTVRSLSKESSLRASIASVIDPGDRLTVYAADLTQEAGWDVAVAGCDYVLHVASPLGADFPKDPNVLIVPAREGALRVLRAATKAGVKRVVLTSSGAASSLAPNDPDGVSDETLWSDPEAKNLTAYRKSKIIAERAAWDFMKDHAGTTNLTTILPALVLGPVLTAEGLGSVQIVQRLLNGALPGIPNLGFNLVDVRDVAELHVRAMTAPAAAEQRFLASGPFLWMAEVANILRAQLGDRARKIPTRRLPDFLLRLGALLDPALKSVTPMLGHRHDVNSTKAQKVLGWTPRPVTTTLIDCAQSLIARGAA